MRCCDSHHILALPMEVVSHDFGMDANVVADFIAEQGVVRDFTFVNEY